MKKIYEKPFLIEEEVEIEDIIANSGEKYDPDNLIDYNNPIKWFNS